jgi:small nuclear ribonucleoprotein E
MTGRGGGGGGRKTLLAPIHFIFKLLQQRSLVSIWLYEQMAIRIEGKIRVGDATNPHFHDEANIYKGI